MPGFELIAKAALEVVIKTEIQKFYRARSTKATHILIEELRTAKVTPEEATERDDVAAMMVSFYMAMAEGAAFANLRLIAKVLANKAADANARTDDFLMWKDAIASLLPEEAILLAALHRHFVDASGSHQGEQIRAEAIKRLKRDLIGGAKVFKTEREYDAVCAALARTGFVVPISGWGGGMTIEPSPRLTRLAVMANLQAWADEQNEPID